MLNLNHQAVWPLRHFEEDSRFGVSGEVCYSRYGRSKSIKATRICAHNFFMDVAGLVTSLVTKRDQTLAVQLEESMRKGESLEGLTNSREKLEYMKKKEIDEKRKAKAQKLGEKYPKSGKWDVGKSKINSQRGTRGAARTALNSKPSNTSTGGSSRPGRSRNASGIAMKRR